VQLKSKLLALLLPLLIAPLLLQAFAGYVQLRAFSEERAEREVVSLMNQLYQHHQETVETAVANVQLFANSAQLQTYLLTESEADRYQLLQPSLLRLLASYQAAYPEYYEIRVLLPDGYEDTRSALAAPANTTEDESESELWQHVVSSDHNVLVRFQENPDNGRFSLYVSKPVWLKNASVDPILANPILRGYLVLTVDLSHFIEHIVAGKVGEGGYLFAVDSSGTIQAHPDDVRVGETLPEALFTRLRKSTLSDTPAAVTLDGVPYYLRGKQLAANFWLFSGVPEAEFYAAGKRMAVIVAGITLLAILLTAVLVFAFTNAVFIKPVQTLRDAARKIGQGNLLVDVPTYAADEIGELANAFREMGTNLHQSQEQIRFHAYHDNLTGLPNRFMFHERLEQAVNRAKQNRETLGVLFADVDGFKRVNDTLGHHAGDELLRQISERVHGTVRQADVIGQPREIESSPNVVSRIGGDEFVVLAGQLTSTTEASKIAQRIIESVGRPYMIMEQEIYVGISVGIALYPDDGDDAKALLKSADTAMFHAKVAGKNNFQFFDPQMNAVAINQLSLEADLHRAMQGEELSLVYQPIIDLSSGRTIGAEALLRWNHPDQGMIPPGVFIPIAEETGLINPLGDWILRHAFKQVNDWRGTAASELVVSINISGHQIANPNFCATVRKLLEETDIPRRCLDFEVTETSIMRMELHVDEAFREIHDLGITISLDDFGTGYSSLSHLRRFPIDYLKIDRSFVDESLTNPDDQAIVSAIISMAQNLGLEVVAEGVETAEQSEMLRSKGCEYAQGYYYGKPMTADDILRRIEQEAGGKATDWPLCGGSPP
jgi:diguanylate cyclase (GGDEF)-like protein